MYQFSGKLKMLSLALIIIGALGIGFSFFSAPKTIEESKEMIADQASHGDSHGSEHATGAANSHDSQHDAKHDEHVFHQMQNKPWSALYVSLIFFLGISLLVLAFYASQRVAQSGWSVVLFRADGSNYCKPNSYLNYHVVGNFISFSITLESFIFLDGRGYF